MLDKYTDPGSIVHILDSMDPPSSSEEFGTKQSNKLWGLNNGGIKELGKRITLRDGREKLIEEGPEQGPEETRRNSKKFRETGQPNNLNLNNPQI